RTMVSAAGRQYKHDASLKALSQGMRPVSGPVAVSIRVFRPRKVGDADNVLKAALDSLKGVAYADDDQIVELHLYRDDDKDRPRIEVEVTAQSLGASVQP